MKVTAPQLRAERYRILDRVLETGELVEVICERGTVVIKPRARKRKPKPNPRRRRVAAEERALDLS